ncbi:MAG: ABC transporter ATP-binding protein [Chloroflexi bacterium]|nr:ABC transporter ATP-binding protein [Chloroflexota bacterium]
MIEISNVTKRYYNLTALDNVSLTIPEGEVIGLLGPNGAGKTTLLKLITGILKPDNGRLHPIGHRPWPQTGYKPDRLLYPNQLRVSQYLKMIAGLSNIPSQQIEKAVFDSLVRVDLLNAANKRIRDCSKGMRQRIGLAQVLIGNPPLLLLDEPSNGLDPSGQADMNRRIQELHAAGKTIIMSSHQLQEVTQVCTQLVILKQGTIHYQNSMATALAMRSHVILESDQDLTYMQPHLQGLHEEIEIEGNFLILRGEAMRLRRQVMTMLLSADYDILHVEEKKVTLTEIYAEAVQ